jgi:hypothetical protein
VRNCLPTSQRQRKSASEEKERKKKKREREEEKTDQSNIVSRAIVGFSVWVLGSVSLRGNVAAADPGLVVEVEDDTATEQAEGLGEETEVLVVVAERRDRSRWSAVKGPMLS